MYTKPKVYLFNTLGKKKQEFKSIRPGEVRMYNCGPTIYDYAHIGNLRAFTFADVLRRTLEWFGYKVVQVMNITDVGHLTSDDDLGEDKIVKGLKREQAHNKDITIYDIINLYTKAFLEDCKAMNFLTPTYMPKASEHIEDMIKIIQTLIDKGFAYVTKRAVYFDVSKFKDYTKLSNQALSEKIVGARNEVNVDPDKKHPADFRLWQLDRPNHLMQWDSPWGRGFPGWHIECSAMSMKYLGETLDIHTGGVDHIPVHHTNEIAQSEACTGKPFAHYWLHCAFLKVDGKKMSKSLGNFYTLRDLVKKGFSPMALRYFYLTAQYNKPLNFTFDALKASQVAYNNMLDIYQQTRSKMVLDIFKSHNLTNARDSLDDVLTWWQDNKDSISKDLNSTFSKLDDIDFDKVLADSRFKSLYPTIYDFSRALADNLNTPNALAVLWKLLKEQDIKINDLFYIFPIIDKVLGLEFLGKISKLESLINKDEAKLVEVLKLFNQRSRARLDKDWETSDKIRDKLVDLGFKIKDMKNNYVIY